MKLNPICHIHTAFKDKFGIPRQSGLIPEAIGELYFPNDNFHNECLRGITDFSHLWLTFIFDKVLDEGHRSLVRPPRLGGKEKVGVWATRSPHRPNHLGLSVVKFIDLTKSKKEICLKVGGVDLLDKTPIVDIRPYVPYCDNIEASSAWVPRPRDLFVPKVLWVKEHREKLSVEEARFVEKVLEQDPRPSAQKGEKESYVFNLFDYEIRFKNGPKEFLITSIIRKS